MRDGLGAVRTAGIGAHHGLALLDVLLPEEKLSIQVGEVYGIEVEERDVAKAGQDDVLDCVWKRR